MTIGTCHFTSKRAACRYYADYGFDASDVARKIREGEIKIGAPAAKPGERVWIKHTEGRYHVTTSADGAP